MADLGQGAIPSYGFQPRGGAPTYYPPVGGTPTRTDTPVSQSTIAKNQNDTAIAKSSGAVAPIYGPTKTISAPTPTPALKPAPAASTAAEPATPAPAAAPLYDPNIDPIYQQVQAQAVQAKQDAEAAATAATNQLAIQYTDPALALDPTTAAAAAGNQYGVLGVLAHQQPLDAQALDETLNKQNLFYSGARINQQGELANTYLQKHADAVTAEQQALAKIQSDRLAAILGAQSNVSQANSDAYGRYLTQLLANLTPTAAGAAPAAPAGGALGPETAAYYNGSVPATGNVVIPPSIAGAPITRAQSEAYIPPAGRVQQAAGGGYQTQTKPAAKAKLTGATTMDQLLGNLARL